MPKTIKFLTLEEHELKSRLKKLGILKKFKNGALNGVAKNGGVAIVCGDGDIDVMNHHEKEVSKRRHCKADFGGMLLVMQEYRGFTQTYAFGLVENIKFGLSAKQTETIFGYFHYPCAAAIYHKHTFKDVIRMMASSPESLRAYGFKKIYIFLHVRRINKHEAERQNTYLVDTDLLKQFIDEGGLD